MAILSPRKLMALFLIGLPATSIPAQQAPSSEVPLVAKKRVLEKATGDNLLQSDGWRPWQVGYELEDGTFVCDNGGDTQIQRGASQTVMLNQEVPAPLVATAWSRAEGITGSPDSGYSLYLDLIYDDGTPLWGQTASFRPGTHEWERQVVVILPDRPVRQLTFHLLLRGHAGKALFRDPQLLMTQTPPGTCRFDGALVVPQGPPREGFQIRDVAADSDFVHIETGQPMWGLTLTSNRREQNGATIIDAQLEDTTGRDRAVTLVYSVPVPPDSLRWFEDPRTTHVIQSGREYLNASRFRVAGGRLSRYPLAAVADDQSGTALGIDMAHPAFYRLAYHADTHELYLAYDLALTAEKPTARVRFCQFPFDPQWQFRSALARYYEVFPEAFRCRTPEQGIWMPFAAISRVERFEDFGFKFKEGNNETAWDDQHQILTFRYTEPMTWWMPLPEKTPRTLDAALEEAERLVQQGNPQAQALLTSGYHDEEGRIPARLLDTPWCNGAVWSINSMPGIPGSKTDFQNKWNPTLRQKLYEDDRSGRLDGEYIDSSEGYVTDELDFRRDHFAAADTPLTFAADTAAPAIFRGAIAFEYIRGIAQDVHAMDKLMMANSTPIRLCWLAPLLDVLGTETDWNPNGTWQPMPDHELLYRRALCKGKPFCFLMNTRFEEFSHELVERYMKRALAYGMFPGFFSHNASQGHYFSRPELYNRDRSLFQKYNPLCKRVAEAGWEPITRAATDDSRVYVERFGKRYLTVLNDNSQPSTFVLRLDFEPPTSSHDLVSGQVLTWSKRQTTMTLAAEDVAVIDLGEE